MPAEFIRPLEEEQPVPQFVRPIDEKQAAIDTSNDVSVNAQSILSQATKPLRRTMQVYRSEERSGRALMREGLSTKKQSVWRRVFNLIGGAAQYVFSPVTAAARGMVGEPIEEAIETYDFTYMLHADPFTGKVVQQSPEDRKRKAEFLGKLGEEAVWFVPAGATIRELMMLGKPGLKAYTKMKEVPKLLPSKLTEDVKTPVGATWEKAKLPKMETKGSLKQITKPQMTQELMKDIVDGSKSALQGNFDESRRIFKQTADALSLNEINAVDIPEILAKHKLSPEQFAKMYAETVSFGGRILGYHGRAAQELRGVFNKNPEALAILDDAFKKEMGRSQPYLSDKLWNAFGKVENFRRAMLVGQVATAVRNGWSQAGRISLSAFDEALQGVLMGSVGGKGNTLRELQNGLNVVTSAVGRLKPKARKRLFNILDQNHAALSKMRLFAQPVHEVQLGGKIAHAVNILNRTQEHFFRKLAFESKLRTLLNRKGLKYNTINPKHIPDDMLEESVNYALEMTFAASPKTKAGQEFVRAWTRYGGTLINPFPRFNFSNALPFILDHSPLGYLHAMSPQSIKALASGKPEVFAKAASRATIGSLMLDSAMHVRQSKYAGEKWYEIKTSEKPDGSSSNIDTRAFAPFSTYLFLAEALVNPDNLLPRDFGQALIGLNRIAGTGLVVVDWFNKDSVENVQQSANKFAGQYLGSFAVPVKSLSDAYSAFDDEERIYRDYRDDPFVHPFLSNLPKVSQRLPERYSPLKTARMKKGEDIERLGVKVPAGVFRQLTGLSKRVKTVVEREVDRLKLPWGRIAPATGNPKADRLLSKYMAPYVEFFAPIVMNNQMYKRLPDHLKQEYLVGMFAEARREARSQLLQKNWKLAVEIGVSGLNKNIEKEVRSRMQFLRPLEE